MRLALGAVGARSTALNSSKAQRETGETVDSRDDSAKVDTLALSADTVRLASRFRAVREVSAELARPLSPEDCCAQSMEDASPTKWHLAHTSWFFETFVLEAARSGYRPFDPSYRVLFNSYYESVGRQHPRPRRGLLTRPDLATVRAYREHVDGEILALLQEGALSDSLLTTLELGLHHEQQHQELLLTDAKHLLSCNPRWPAYREELPVAPRCESPPLRWRRGREGLHSIGHLGVGFGFDNEGPRHPIFVAPHELASRLVNNGEYRDFIADGGYARPELWLSEGWATRKRAQWETPAYWLAQEGAWQIFGLGGMRALDPAAPVAHLSFFEADAYARWAGARLPLESEWELAAKESGPEDNLLETGWLEPAAPRDDNAEVPAQLFGDVWEWTSSPYQAYPGYRAAKGALGEYNGKFMCNQYVLRGGSCATPRSHIRASYRNFFPAPARWQWSGLRLARDL